jgi:hypothetical protein
MTHLHLFSPVHEGTGFGRAASITNPTVERQRRRSFEDTETYHDGSSVAMLLADMSNHERSTSSHPASISDLPFGAPATTRTVGRRPSTAPGSGAAPYHLPTSLVRSPGENAENPSSRVHGYPPDAKTSLQDPWESSETTDWGAHRGAAGTARSHPYATAQSPHSDLYSTPFDSGDIMTLMVEGTSSRSRGAGERHPYADPLNATSDDDEEDEGGRRRVLEHQPSHGDVVTSNQGRRRGGGG